MNDTMVTLVGNAATAVEHRQTTAGVPVARFRMAATSRRFDRTRDCWTDAETSFYTVRSWRGLADNVAASVAVGEPLVVHGRLRVREGEQSPERGGQRWFAAEVDAVAIGHDLTRGTAAFRRVSWARTDPVPPQLAAAGGTSTVTDAGAGAGADADADADAEAGTEAETVTGTVTGAETGAETGAVTVTGSTTRTPHATSEAPVPAPAPAPAPALVPAPALPPHASNSPEKASVPEKSAVIYR